MGRWVKPEVYPLMAAMTFVTSMCVFQLTRNAFLNPDVQEYKSKRRMRPLFTLMQLTKRPIKKEQRMKAVLDNAEEGEKYSQHGFRKLLYRNRPWIFPAANFSSSSSGGSSQEN